MVTEGLEGETTVVEKESEDKYKGVYKDKG